MRLLIRQLIAGILAACTLSCPLSAHESYVGGESPDYYQSLTETQRLNLSYSAEVIHVAHITNEKSMTSGINQTPASCPTMDPGIALPPPVPSTPTCPSGYQWTIYPGAEMTQCVQIACDPNSGTAVKSSFDLVKSTGNTYSYPVFTVNVAGQPPVQYGMIQQTILYNDLRGAQCVNYFVGTMNDALVLERVEPKTPGKIESSCDCAPDVRSGVQLQFCIGLPLTTPIKTCPASKTCGV